MQTQRGFGLNGILVAIVIILAVGTAGIYVVKNGNFVAKEIDSVEEKAVVENKTDDLSSTASVTEDWKMYRNEEYGFELILTDIWAGYRVIEKKNYEPYQPTSVINFLFAIPTSNKLWNIGDGKDGWWIALTISRWTRQDWNKKKKAIEEDPTLGWMSEIIVENDLYVFSFEQPHDVPRDSSFSRKNFGYDRIFSTFKFIE